MKTIRKTNDLHEPTHKQIAACCNFGREAVTNDSRKYFERKSASDKRKYHTPISDQDQNELNELYESSAEGGCTGFRRR